MLLQWNRLYTGVGVTIKSWWNNTDTSSNFKVFFFVCFYSRWCHCYLTVMSECLYDLMVGLKGSIQQEANQLSCTQTFSRHWWKSSIQPCRNIFNTRKSWRLCVCVCFKQNPSPTDDTCTWAHPETKREVGSKHETHTCSVFPRLFFSHRGLTHI